VEKLFTPPLNKGRLGGVASKVVRTSVLSNE
jgi:hypothetical protein